MNKLRDLISLTILFLLSSLTAIHANEHIVQPDHTSPVSRTNIAFPPHADISINPITGRVQTINFGEEPFSASGGSPSAVVNQFLSNFQHLFGITNFNAQLKLTREAADQLAAEHNQVSVKHLSYAQTCRGVPVFGAELRFHLNANNQINLINGATSPDFCLPQFPTAAQVSAEEATNVAIAHVRDQVEISNNETLVALKPPELSILDRVILRPSMAAEFKKEGPKLTWQIVIGSNNGRIRHQVFVDALQGNVVEEWNMNPDALVRRLWKLGLVLNEFWKEGDPLPTQDPEVNTLLDFTEKTYKFYRNLDYESWDGKGAQYLIIDDLFSDQCPNAFWDGQKTNFCPGIQCDDVIVHEWTHAYTETTHGLIYMDQSGALNEAYSDIMAAPLTALNTVDPGKKAKRQVPRTNGGCTTLTGGTDNSLRWIVAGNCPGFPQGLRDMFNPACYRDPGAVNDNLFFCGPEDNGGVHTNSGVPNHGFALIVDGGSFNGVQVRGIGAVKAVQLYWRAATVYQTPTTNFVQHADAIIKSCDDFRLAGTQLKDPFTGAVTGGQITQDDCNSVKNAFEAVKMRETPCRGPGPDNGGVVLSPNPPPLCTRGSPTATFFSENAEDTNNVALWRTSKTGFYPFAGWVHASLEGYFNLHGNAFWAQDSPSDCLFQTFEGGTALISPVITIPSNVPANAELRLAFDHFISSEAGYDGGALFISVNGGQFVQVPASAFVFNGYNTKIRPDAPGNPLIGLSVWSGTPATGADKFYQTQVKLAGARPGDRIQLQWFYGIDECVGVLGWVIDNIKVYSCSG